MKHIPLFFILLSLVLAIYFYPWLPDTLVTHWGIDGQPNGYSSKMFGLFFVPILQVALYFLFSFLPKADLYKRNFDQFAKYYHHFVGLVMVFLSYIHVLTLIWNLGCDFSLVQFMMPSFALLFYYAGVLNTHAKRNWFVGIRTPWTISSQKVWDKTHLLGGKLFKVVALFCLVGTFWPNLAFHFLFFPLMIVVIFLFAYSYYLYLRQK